MRKLLNFIGVLLGIGLWVSSAYCQSLSEDQEKEIYKDMLHQERLMAQSDTGEDMEIVFIETADFYNISPEEAEKLKSRITFLDTTIQELKVKTVELIKRWDKIKPTKKYIGRTL